MCSYLIQVKFIISGNSVVKISITASETVFYFIDRCSLMSAPASADDIIACFLWVSFLAGLKFPAPMVVAG